MKKMIVVFTLFIGILSYAQQTPKVMKSNFSSKALNDKVKNLKGESVTIGDVLAKNKGKVVVLELWASWCVDCLIDIPEHKKLQEKNPDITFVNFSMDKTIDAWKKAIETYKLQGENYYLGKNWKGDFGTEIDLNWIPRYLVIDKKGNIANYYSTKAGDSKIQDTIDKLK